MKIINYSSLIAALCLVTALFSCGSSYEKSAPSFFEQEEASADYMKASPSAKRSGFNPAGPDQSKADVNIQQAAEPQEPQQRKRIYSGFLHLIVADPGESRSLIAVKTDEVGGYVVSSSDEMVEIQVPAPLFEEVMAYLEGLGAVVDRSIQTADVTEAYSDFSARMKVHQQTRERLYQLLEKSADAEERLEILREIRRLTEEIESLKATLAELDQRIAFSRITIRLESRMVSDQEQSQSIPFPWIAELHPLYPSLEDPPKGNTLEPGSRFALFEKEEEASLRAEAADGTRIRLGSVENHPRGDNAFWRKALSFHLGPLYASAEETSWGPYTGLLFESKDSVPFYYGVIPLVKDDRIVVAEAFFPNRDSYEKYQNNWFEALVLNVSLQEEDHR